MIFHTARLATEKAVFRPALPSCSLPGIAEMQMGKMSYGDQLKHPNWQKRRLEKQEAAGWKCEICGEAEKMLHVHHREYFKGRMAWEYSNEELKVLCESCHTEQHDVQELLKVVLGTSDSLVDSHFVAVGLMAGYLSGSYSVDGDVAKAAEERSRLYFHLGVLAYHLATSGLKEVKAIAEILQMDKQEGPVAARFRQWLASLER